MSSGATPGPEVIELGPAPGLGRSRLRTQFIKLCRRLMTRRVLLVVALFAVAVALVAAALQYRHRVAAEDRVSLATGVGTNVSVDLATRTLLLDLFIDNRGAYPITLVNISVVTPGLAVVPGTAGNDGGRTRLPAKVPRDQTFEKTLIVRPDCTKRLPKAPKVRLVATSSRGRHHAMVLPPFGPLAQLWTMSVRSACFDKPQ